MYREAATTIVRHLGIIDFDLIGRLDLAEYRLIVDAIEKRAEDEDKDMHWLAYLASLAGEHDAKGKPRFPRFKDFYSHKSQTQQDRFARLKEHLRSKDE